MKNLYIAIIIFMVYVSFGFYLLNRFDSTRAEIKRQTAIIKAESERDTAKTDSDIARINAQISLEKVKVRSDPDVAETIKRAEKTKAWLSAWFPVYFPLIMFAGSGVLLATYISFRLVEFKYNGIETRIRAFDAPRLAQASLQVQFAEATQGVNVLQLADQMQRHNLTALGSFARGMRGLMGRESAAIESKQTALPSTNLPVQSVPSFADLLNAGKFQAGFPLVFGFQENGSPKTGTWQDAYSLGIAGLSGFGKSATIRFLMSESLLTRAVGRFYVIDPHFPHEKSLLASLGDLKNAPQVTYAENPIDTSELIDDIHAAIDRRLKGEEPSEPLMVVVIDELIPAVKTFPAVSRLVERIGMESRKAGVYGIFASQSWNGDKTGGTTARDNLTALLVHRMKPKQANTLLQDSGLARKVTRLSPGQVLFAPVASDPELLTVPYCSKNDMPEVVKRLSITQETTTEAIDGLTDAQLIGRVNLKKGMLGNNEFARMIGQDIGLTSKSLRGLSLPLFPAVRAAFVRFLQE